MAEEGSFKKLLIPLILTMLFGFFLITFVQTMGTSYNVDTSQVILMNSTDFQNSLVQLNESTNILTSLTSGDIVGFLGEVITGGIFSIAKSMMDIVSLPFVIIQHVLTDVLQLNSIVATTINGLFMLILAFAIWRWIRIGD